VKEAEIRPVSAKGGNGCPTPMEKAVLTARRFFNKQRYVATIGIISKEMHLDEPGNMVA
jgi:hypothetical protein